MWICSLLGRGGSLYWISMDILLFTDPGAVSQISKGKVWSGQISVENVYPLEKSKGTRKLIPLVSFVAKEVSAVYG